MSALIVIPARYASTRYPGKPLVALTGASGQKQTLIERSWRAASAVSGVDRVVVATDDDRIREAAEGFGAEVVMTSESCANGTERCAEAHAALGGGYDIVVNLQGDAPLTPHWFVEGLVQGLTDNPEAEIATPVLRCDGATLNSLLADRKAGRVGGTTAVFGADNQALYFSKEVVPYTGKPYAETDMTPVFHHVGVYAYRPDALAQYPSWPVGPLEQLEGLEQLRFLENGRAVLCAEVEAKGREFWELNNPEDVPKLEAMMAKMGLE
ncbi:3-deoxy-manno-octulosonate cytidylyltransferase [Sulfitobacter sp. KE34]|jgi:3-deoxy-manno-octulosonate cytidylyltransferase (CMP-KDO synthetase)|uniref:3-deoxy-manno-octulosonate cytidylyltransferase n=1 Tax=Sulfitobacter faviae TaxID=1775881 RepID=A0AAX3LP46_9RHOB|nr:MULTISPECIES: manno-octulosonate cytidylyltransferase [Sulfitobacter]MDF3349830.1 3-deoxy-manno-octulosonate cytidylyltransferase [Sulfitobacter sp. KE12]MDF3353502.1 3-deoxy-manno-octulosonate cytidylyltransferase [Sulfitobacter sp. KE27]MDF3357149.1 3-deoxy-manno-octulosonate cytidylyltransferase [Sulfitobacter sp. KE33]MDF3361510.1 3-deoxy-manno-octulosonate cytidylyltransferase [Sulfitobacter sp. Ks41]MDF3364573.1 3-deoxy-manno-octulosonate cytidylyltransferase [Sulfitobacter sp. Ks34]